MHREKFPPYEPCPCGSGKKYKFCCLNGRQQVSVSDPTFWGHPPGQPDAAPPAGGEWVEYVFVKEKGWTHESELKPGDQYRLKGGGWGTVEPERVIGTTQEHPFNVQGKGWTPVGEISPGDMIRTDNGWVQVSKIEDTGRYETVYNLKVADYHTYFVGAQDWGFGVWSHNAYHPESDPETRQQGEQFRQRAEELWGTLPEGRRFGATVAVSRVDGVEVVSLYANIGSGRRQFSQAQINRFRTNVEDSGGVFIHTAGDVHAEKALHQAYSTAPAIGISNPNGPCANRCGKYFAPLGYYNLHWPGDNPAQW